MRIAVIGCGSLGGVIAGRLSLSYPGKVTIISRNREINSSIGKNGLVLIDQKAERKSIPVSLIEKPEQCSKALDMAIVTTKIDSLFRVAKEILPFLSDTGKIVTVQNGLAGLDLKRELGHGKVLVTSVLWGASMLQPGVYEITAGGVFVAEKPEDDMGAEVTDALSKVFPVKTRENIEGVLWAKLTVNASLTSLGAITGLSFGVLVRDKRIRNIIIDVGREIYAVAKARGIRFERLPGGLDIEILMGIPKALSRLLIMLIGKKHSKTESSMLASIVRGRKTEVDYLNGLVVAMGNDCGVPVPVNRKIVEIVKRMEAGEIKPAPDNINLF